MPDEELDEELLSEGSGVSEHEVLGVLSSTPTWQVPNLLYRGPGHLLRRRHLERKAGIANENGLSPEYDGVRPPVPDDDDHQDIVEEE